MERTELENWNELIRELPAGHLLQTREWADVKTRYGWEALPFIWRDVDRKVVAAALILKRGLRFGIHILYVPRGPLMDWSNGPLRERVLADLENFARKQRSIFLKMDPEVVLGTGIPLDNDSEEGVGQQIISALKTRNWRFSDGQIQFRNTVWLHLIGTESDWLERMKQKTRYNIRLAERKGVVVRVGNADDFHTLYQMYAETSLRDGFVIRPEEYYRFVWSTFTTKGMAAPLIAEVAGEPVAAIFLFWSGARAWYLYGMSTQKHRELMPNYLLQWEAMKLAKLKGCEVYDLWGAPDVFDESDSMWGVFRFKEGLGGEVIRTIGAWDYAVSPILYQAYTQILPKVLNVMRGRGKLKTQHEVGA